MTGKIPKILVYGYGNPGRQDDGLGVLLAEEIEKWTSARQFDHVHTDSNYQLNLEDAAGIAHYDLVIFADASREDIEHFSLVPLEPSEVVEFTMHAVSPAFILHLCSQVFDHMPRAYLLHIRGYEWEFMGQLTETARKNLNLATERVKNFILDTLVLSD
ncbi:MAG TPA: hydrogenase maturation protease [Bacteroidales bacterium]|nr:hydrogenase maturation protease [Bacteroidales bacterium]